uniref:Uncharacterized protein n=1 Tax=Arundo donax TaxID=35708 RepID=A0A0A8ZDM8_ARUDO
MLFYAFALLYVVCLLHFSWNALPLYLYTKEIMMESCVSGTLFTEVIVLIMASVKLVSTATQCGCMLLLGDCLSQ